MNIEQSLQRIHKVRDAYKAKLYADEYDACYRTIGASKIWVLNVSEGFIEEFSIETVSQGSIMQDTEQFTVKLADGKDLAATLEGLAEVAEQFLEVL